MSKLLIAFPTRNRPKIFLKQLMNLYEKLSNKNDYEIIVTFDTDDKTMNNSQMIHTLNDMPNLKWQDGLSNSKIHAVNRSMEIQPKEWNILLLISDDMSIQKKDFDDIIIKDMEKFAKGKHALNYNDGRRKDQLCTLSIMNKELYDHFGYIYHPQYKSQWCDNQYTEICKEMKCMTDIDNVIIKHEWASLTGKDELFQKNSKDVSRDKETYKKRKEQGFPK